MKARGLTCCLLLIFAAHALAACGSTAVPGATSAPADSVRTVRVALTHTLPVLDGTHLAVTLVEVLYAPGGSSKPHSHPCPVVGYVVEGAYRSQVRGEAESTYTAGQSFYEAPNSVHAISANASAERPVKFLASFTCDRATELSVAVPEITDSVPKRAK